MEGTAPSTDDGADGTDASIDDECNDAAEAASIALESSSSGSSFESEMRDR